MKDYSDLLRRLNGEYRINIINGLGPAGGDEPGNDKFFVRKFPPTPIELEAAEAIKQLLTERSAYLSAYVKFKNDHSDALQKVSELLDRAQVAEQERDVYKESFLREARYKAEAERDAAVAEQKLADLQAAIAKGSN